MVSAPGLRPGRWLLGCSPPQAQGRERLPPVGDELERTRVVHRRGGRRSPSARPCPGRRGRRRRGLGLAGGSRPDVTPCTSRARESLSRASRRRDLAVPSGSPRPGPDLAEGEATEVGEHHGLAWPTGSVSTAARTRAAVSAPRGSTVMSVRVGIEPVAASSAVRVSRSRRRASLRTQSTAGRCAIAPRKARKRPLRAVEAVGVLPELHEHLLGDLVRRRGRVVDAPGQAVHETAVRSYTCPRAWSSPATIRATSVPSPSGRVMPGMDIADNRSGHYRTLRSPPRWTGSGRHRAPGRDARRYRPPRPVRAQGVAMKTKAAILWERTRRGASRRSSSTRRRPGEVLVKMAAVGMCHSDEHVVTGDLPVRACRSSAGTRAPVWSWRSGRRQLARTPATMSCSAFIPACGRCPSCSTGHQNLCDLGAITRRRACRSPTAPAATMPAARTCGCMCLLGTFAHHTVGQRGQLHQDRRRTSRSIGPACWAAAWSPVGARRCTPPSVQPGDTVAVVGIGGIGANAIQGAQLAGRQADRRHRPGGVQAREGDGVRCHAHARRRSRRPSPLMQEITWGRWPTRSS